MVLLVLKKAKASNKGESAKRPVSFVRKGFTFQKRLLLLLLPVLLLITYSHTLHSPFVFDDIAHVSENPAVADKSVAAITAVICNNILTSCTGLICGKLPDFAEIKRLLTDF